MKGCGLNPWVNLAPLLGPVLTYFFRTANKTAFKCTRPLDIWCHQGKGSIDIAGVKRCIGSAKQVKNSWIL